MTGSILPCARGLGEVAAVLLERLVLLFGVVARDAVRAAHLAQRVEHRVVVDAERRAARSPTPPGTSVIASRRCSVERYSSSSCVALLVGRSRARGTCSAPSRASRTVAPLTCGSFASASSTRRRTAPTSTPMRSRTPVTMPSRWSSSARSRCSGAISVLPASRPSACAAPSASWVLRVNLFGSSAMATSSHRVLVPAVRRARATTVLQRDELVPVLPVRGLDPLLHLALQRVDARLELGDPRRVRRVELLLEREDALHAGQRDAVVGELLDAPQQLRCRGRSSGGSGRSCAPARAVPCARRCAASAGARPRARPRPRSRTAPRVSHPSELLRFCVASSNSAARGSSSSTARERLDRLALRARRARSGTCTSTVTSRSPPSALAACARRRRTPLPAHAQHLAARRSRRDPHRHLAVERRHLHVGAERGFRERDRQPRT